MFIYIFIQNDTILFEAYVVEVNPGSDSMQNEEQHVCGCFRNDAKQTALKFPNVACLSACVYDNGKIISQDNEYDK